VRLILPKKDHARTIWGTIVFLPFLCRIKRNIHRLMTERKKPRKIKRTLIVKLNARFF